MKHLTLFTFKTYLALHRSRITTVLPPITNSVAQRSQFGAVAAWVLVGSAVLWLESVLRCGPGAFRAAGASGELSGD